MKRSQDETARKSMVWRKLGLALLLSVLLGSLAACDNEGPAEEAGENIDEEMENAGEGVEEMGEDIQESAEDAQDN